MNQLAPDPPSRPLYWVTSGICSAVQVGPSPLRPIILRSTIRPSMCMYTIESPFGDQTGAHDRPSFVRRRTSLPFRASRIATSVPSVLVFVTAIVAPVGRPGRLHVARAR